MIILTTLITLITLIIPLIAMIIMITLITPRFGHEEVTEVLLTAGADPNLNDSATGTTPLWVASLNGHEQVRLYYISISLSLSLSLSLDIRSYCCYSVYMCINNVNNLDNLDNWHLS